MNATYQAPKTGQHRISTKPEKHSAAIESLKAVTFIGEKLEQEIKATDCDPEQAYSLARIAYREAMSAFENGAFVDVAPDGMAIACCLGGFIRSIYDTYGEAMTRIYLTVNVGQILPSMLGPKAALLVGPLVDKAISDLKAGRA